MDWRKLSSQRKLFFCSVGTWGRLIFFLSAGFPLNSERPGHDDRKIRRNALQAGGQARMHCAQATAIFVLTAVQLVHDVDLIAALPLIGELRRIVQNQDWPILRGKALTYRAELPFQDLRLADPLVGEDAVSRLGVRPVLAIRWMLWPIAPAIRSSSFRNRCRRRTSAKLQPANPRSTISLRAPSIGTAPL